VVFKYSLRSKTFSLVHGFSGLDGAQPSGALITDGLGNFYGTTLAGGSDGYGTVFKFNSSGTLTTLYSFTNGTDRANPYGGVTLDTAGQLVRNHYPGRPKRLGHVV
jgi:uncharacterized repeat protein (TIGR03803 family)